MLSKWLALGILTLLVGIGYYLSYASAFGNKASFAWLAGGVLGFTLQRSRFCFFCNFRDFWERRDSGGLLAILLALAVGLAGYHVVTGAWIVDPAAGHLPPKAHISPVGWHLVLGGFVFGLGMAISGSCISAHLYRIGEGSLVCLFALLGLVPGFVIGYAFWNPVYLALISNRPAIWIPAQVGFFGALVLQVLVLGALAFFIVRVLSDRGGKGGGAVVKAVFVDRWPWWVGGLIIGLLSTAMLLRIEPMGVTSEFSRLARWLGHGLGVLPERLEGLDAVRGCGARPAEGFFSNGVLFIAALILASLGSAIAANEFSLEWPRPIPALAAVFGGVLLGLGATWSFGCTIGTLLSGIHASALSGWVFGLCLMVGLLVGLPLRRRIIR